MPRKFNLKEYIDDIADASSSSSSDYSPNNNNSIEDNNRDTTYSNKEDNNTDKLKDNASIEEKIIHRKKNQRQNREQLLKQTIEDDDKQINAILNRNFKRIKGNNDSDYENSSSRQFIVKNKPTTSLTQVTPKIQKMRIGFKKNAHLPTKDYSTQEQEKDLDGIVSPNKDMVTLLKYSHDKRMKQKINEESSDFVKKFEQRIKEDDEILLNVIKKNNISQKNDWSDNNNKMKMKMDKDKTLFSQKYSMHQKGGFLNMIKEINPSAENNNNKKQQYKMINQKQNGGTIHFNNENMNKKYLNEKMIDKIESIFK